jgi:hypothetical protein
LGLNLLSVRIATLVRTDMPYRRTRGLAPLFRIFEVKLGDAFAKVFSGAQSAMRGIGRGGVSLAGIDDVMARASLLLISGKPQARSMMSVV